VATNNKQTQTYGPYSPIRQAGNLFLVSGQVGVDPITKQAGKTIQEQTSQALANLSDVLAVDGLGMNDVVKTTVYLTDMDDFTAMNDVYLGYFESPRPARSTVSVKELPRVAGVVPIRVEIEAIATKSAN
jgi:2-iminobutanoate/2-iminopropanoate deaminase